MLPNKAWYLHPACLHHEENVAKYRVVGLNYKSPFIYTVHILRTKLVWVGCLLLNALQSIEILFLLCIEVGCVAKLFQRPFTKPPILKRELVLGAERLKLPSCLSRIHSK